MKLSLLLSCKAGLIVSGSPGDLFQFPCISLWLLVSDSLDFSCYGTCFRVSLHASPALANGFRVSGCLSSLVSPYLSPSLAFGGSWCLVWLSRCLSVRVFPQVSRSGQWCPVVWMFSLCFHLASIMRFSLTICLPIYCLTAIMCFKSSVCLSGGV